jgi:hypothetical protein
MKKIFVLGILGLLALVVPAQAAPSYAPEPPAHSHSHRCKPHSIGYNATGTLVSSSLSAEGKGRYSGTLVIDLSRVNHRNASGEQTFTLSAARVVFHHGIDPTAPAPGSRVKLHGKITKLNKHCSTEGFTPTITIKKADISQANTHKG